MPPNGLRQRLEERAAALGFLALGVRDARPLAGRARLERWLADGMHGELGYMERYLELRTDPAVLEPGTRSVIVLATPYDARPLGIGHDDDPLITRYALGDDYHEVLRPRLRALGAFLEAELGAAVNGRPAVDSAPLLEREVAQDAGLGWFGRSSMLINQRWGSYVLLSELLVDVALEPDTERHPDRCGRCTACVDACPTGAILADGVVDARRCISYLTIELRGPIPRALRAPMGLHLFGCDICQAVCPWNRRAPAALIPELAPRPEVARVTALEALALSDEAFRALFRGSAVKRTKRRGLARNAAVVLGNAGDRAAVPALARALRDDPEPLVRGHAAWALGRLGGAAAHAALDEAQRREEDGYVLEEIRAAREEVPTRP